ncbi:spermidine synthase [Gulosibacter sp. ACHW.36C]|uniref:Fused MFS/spermidine synthase n=1 Tax=Gulosibacter sediminis TaxID=1729695 RepID=A0ABY4MVB8_9MICO|nr:fused MFS/spermidine synthase [Gulosibacter sediminis]UQN14376.1 fused MFS/spermidine synthase [Gulosibacter sediminis]
MARQHSPELTRTLASGRQAQFVLDGDIVQLIVDGTPQSQVDRANPTSLGFGYIRHMGHVLDLAFGERQAITALHLGAGALSIPRYVEATRPGSRQQVIELERDLVEFVREVAPLPASASIRVRYGDAREQLAKLPRGLAGSVEVIVVDVFAGPSTPAHVTSVEFFEEIATFLAPDGVVLVNVADGHELRFARGEVASIRAAIGPTLLISDPAVLKGRRFGNIVAVASREELELPMLPRLAASGFPPATVHSAPQTIEWLRGASEVHDAEATDSPVPGRGIFTTGRGRDRG